ncbi:hypothetical protein ES705_22695 [subsurface metagenome]
MKTELSLTNFGPIKYASLEIKPVTVLIGPNNSGKSYAVLAYHTIAQIINEFGNTVRFLGIKRRGLDVKSLLESNLTNEFSRYALRKLKNIIYKRDSSIRCIPIIQKLLVEEFQEEEKSEYSSDEITIPTPVCTLRIFTRRT